MQMRGSDKFNLPTTKTGHIGGGRWHRQESQLVRFVVRRHEEQIDRGGGYKRMEGALVKVW